MTGNYANLLKNLLLPKTQLEKEKVHRLEKLLVKFLLAKFLKDMDTFEAEKFSRHNFSNANEVAQYLKHQVRDFDRKMKSYTQEFINNYVRSN